MSVYTREASIGSMDEAHKALKDTVESLKQARRLAKDRCEAKDLQVVAACLGLLETLLARWTVERKKWS